MTADETELEMVAEQENRIAQQEVLIESLRKIGVPSDDALGLLALMQNLLETMRDHVAFKFGTSPSLAQCGDLCRGRA
jgi:hypothetical protein